MGSDNSKQRTLLGSVQFIQPSSTQQLLDKKPFSPWSMANILETKSWPSREGGWKGMAKNSKMLKSQRKQVTIFSAMWLCQSLLILGHSALNLNILPKSKLINQQNTGLDPHYFSHIKQVEEGKKKPQKQNQGKHINSGPSLCKMQPAGGKCVFLC